MTTQRPDIPHNEQNNPCEELRELLPAFIIGATTAEEAQRVRELLPRCPELAEEVAQYSRVAQGFAEQVEAVTPPPALRGKLLDQIAALEEDDASTEADIAPVSSNAAETSTEEDSAVRFLPPSSRSLPWGWLAAAALALILVGTNVLWFVQTQDLQDQVVTLQVERNRAQALLQAVNLQRVILSSTADEQALANLFWTPDDNEGVLFPQNFPPLPEDQTYQLWLIEGETPVSAGIFQPETGEYRFRADTDLSRFDAIGVSVEPESGSDAPTTTPLAVGAVGQS